MHSPLDTRAAGTASKDVNAMASPTIRKLAIFERARREVTLNCPRRSRIGVVACCVLIATSAAQLGGASVDLGSQPGIAAALVLFVGLPHGALDIEILRRRAAKPAEFSLSRTIVAYIAVGSLVIPIWIFFPVLALCAFLGLSAFHFGGDWRSFHGRWERTLLGGSLLCAPTLLHAPTVVDIFSRLIGSDRTAATSVVGIMQATGWLLSFAVCALAVARWRSHRADCEEIVAVSIAAIVLPPLTFFVIYFCLLHSLRHLDGIRRTLSALSPWELLRRGLPYALAAAAGCVAGIACFGHIEVGDAFLSALLVTLSALTVPHMLLSNLPFVGARVKPRLTQNPRTVKEAF